MTGESLVVIEFFGEGKTDLGSGGELSPPTSGVIPILVYRLCDEPPRMRTKRRPFAFLQGKQLAQKVRFAKRQAYYNGSAGAVFVMDSEGDDQQRRRICDQMTRGRDLERVDLPMAIGVAQPCVEAWLLVDSIAIQRVLNVPGPVNLPVDPESLAAPGRDERRNPKTLLARLGIKSSADKDAVARATESMDVISLRCPIGFGAFAREVNALIRPLFNNRPD